MNRSEPLHSLLNNVVDDIERLRNIEREYEIEIVAENAGQLVHFQAASLRVLSSVSARNLQQMMAYSTTGAKPNTDIKNIIPDSQYADGGTVNSLPNLKQPEDAAPSLDQLETVLVDVFDRNAKRILRKQKAMAQAAESLRQAYEMPFLGMRNEAEKWLLSGMRRTGRDRDEDFNDALRLMRASLDSPFGSGDYVAWFQVGWLLWQHEKNIAGAEDAFYKAQRLSAAQSDVYHATSLRHMAYMQYLRGNINGAYETIQKVLSLDATHDTRFEAARYAALLGKFDETITQLKHCIHERPTTIITMFAESDFFQASRDFNIITKMAELASTLLTDVRERARRNYQHWRMSLSVVETAEKMLGQRITLPDDIGLRALEQIPDIEQADYVTVLDIERRSLASGDKVLHIARDRLRKEIRDATSVLGKAQGELEKLEFASKRRLIEAADWKVEQLEQMPTLMRTLRGRGALINLVFLIVGIGVDFLCLPIVQKALNIKGPEFTYDGTAPLAMYFCFKYLSWVLFGYIAFGLAQLVDVFHRQKMRERIERVYGEVVRVDEAETNSELSALRKNVWEATRRKERAEEALTMIEPS